MTTTPTTYAASDGAIAQAFRERLAEIMAPDHVTYSPEMVWFDTIRQRARKIEATQSAQPSGVAGKIVAWTEKDGDQWIVYDADSDTGKHIRDFQKASHFVSVFPIYDAPPIAQQGSVEVTDAMVERACIAFYEDPATFPSLKPHPAAQISIRRDMRAALTAALASKADGGES